MLDLWSKNWLYWLLHGVSFAGVSLKDALSPVLELLLHVTTVLITTANLPFHITIFPCGLQFWV